MDFIKITPAATINIKSKKIRIGINFIKLDMMHVFTAA